MHICSTRGRWVNTLGPRQNGYHFADYIFKCIFLNENAWVSLKISLKFVPKVQINNIPALVQTMAWRWPGNKPLSEPMMVSLLTHICVTRPQWVNQQTFSTPHPKSPRRWLKEASLHLSIIYHLACCGQFDQMWFICCDNYSLLRLLINHGWGPNLVYWMTPM